jgi:putative spermidine/putrescine transport system substrate-binding protein
MITSRRLVAGWAVAALVAGACTSGGGSPSAAPPSAPAGSPPASEPAASGSATADICTAPPRHDGVTMTFTSFGGVYQEAQRLGWLEPYAALTAVTWQEAEDSFPNPKIQAMVEAGQVEWDVVDVGNDFGTEAHADLLEPLDYSLIKQDEIIEGFAGDYRVADITYGVVLAYNTEQTAGAVPEGWADFFDTAKIPGKRGLWKYAAGGVLEFALMADGVAPDELYPLDVPRALAKLDTIKDEIVWWETGAESQELIGSGEVAMTMIWNGRGHSAKHIDGKPVEIQWNQQILTADYFVIPKGSPNKQAAMEFIAWATCAENNAAVSERIPYGPTNENAEPNEAVAADLAVSNVDDNTAYFDDEYLVDNYATLNEDFQAWLTQ